MDLFDNGNLEEFILFQRQYQIMVKVPGSIDAGTKIQYIHTLLRVEVLHELKTLCGDIRNYNTTHLN